MAILVNQLAQPIEKVTLTTARNVGKGSMKVTKAFNDSSQPLKVKLAEGLDLTCPFEPGAYQRTGAEDRVGIVFRATENMWHCLQPLSNIVATYWSQTISNT